MDDQVKLVNIHAHDIVDGNADIVLGLIWVIILHFHIQEYFKLSAIEQANERVSPYLWKNTGSNASSPSHPTHTSLRRTLLDSLAARFGVHVKDFGSSWRDGYAFLQLIDAILPQVRAVEKGRGVITNRARLQLAFDLADQHLGIGQFLDAEDIDVNTPDERSIMTYVCQFMQKQAASKMPTADEEALKQWVDSVLRTGILSTRMAALEIEFAHNQIIVDRLGANLPSETIASFRLIENELHVAKKVIDWIAQAEGKQVLFIYMLITSCY